MTAPLSPLTYSVEEAAERLGHVVTADWLRKRVDQLPHVKSGNGSGRAGRIAFTDAHLAEILAGLEVRPVAAPTSESPVRRRRSA